MAAGGGSGSSKKQNHQSKFKWYIKAPIRALCALRDFYVRSLTNCAGSANYGGLVSGYPVASVPRSYSVHTARSSTSDDDFRELVRAVSQGKLGSLNLNTVVLERGAAVPGAKGGVVPRSQSVAIGRIDEDKPLEFDGYANLGIGPLYPRSRSAVPTRSRIGPVA